jgi:hypothetical protein
MQPLIYPKRFSFPEKAAYQVKTIHSFRSPEGTHRQAKLTDFPVIDNAKKSFATKVV